MSEMSKAQALKVLKSMGIDPDEGRKASKPPVTSRREAPALRPVAHPQRIERRAGDRKYYYTFRARTAAARDWLGFNWADDGQFNIPLTMSPSTTSWYLTEAEAEAYMDMARKDGIYKDLVVTREAE